ncbi:MAG: tetratricopeptide repeat protein [Bacillota bacterium]
MNNTTYLIISFSFLGLGAIVYFINIFQGKPAGDGLAILIICAALTAGMLMMYYIPQRRYKKASNLLSQQCDPDAFIEKMQKFLDKATQDRKTDSICVFRISLNSGLCAAGRFDEALSVMPDPSLIKKASLINQVHYHHNNFITYLHLGKSNQAELALAWLRDSLITLKNTKLRGLFSQHYQNDLIIFAVSKGNFDGAETAFQDQFVRAKNKLERVAAKFNQGRVHAHFGRTDEAREAFEYVLAHGNKLHVVSLARKALDALRP